ncbi:hypothetical protein J3R30DRAFT_739326 [Lentinula aciculospora]|uniref:Uncharacterized protein n=1 Tax=Lentinula aciculospora TaxID=153920 RepID=A0A9W9DJU4_9AGAR|nr:hypothetical protein J3R30DRAFT_739326 [Lentinula aciculospora]
MATTQILNDVLAEISFEDLELARFLTRLQLAIDSSDLPHELLNDPVLETRLSEEIESRLSSISESLGGDVDTNPLDRAHAKLEDIASLESELSSSWSSAIDVITCINKLHVTLNTELLGSITTISPSLNEKHKATNALSAAAIEASLVKLSLLRAQLQQKLYAFSSDTHPNATMINALSTAYDKLKDEAEDSIKEERVLDSQIEGYTCLMRLVDGSPDRSPRKGFAQIVEDYIRVEKETEECRRDLRRLGWSTSD